jgi:hypothetical protein
MSSELEKFIQQNREAFDDRTPGADVLSRIQERITQTPVKEERPKALVISFRTLRMVAAACVLVLAGFAIWWVNQDASTAEAVVASTKTGVEKNNTTIIPQEDIVQPNTVATTTATEKSTGEAAQYISKENDQQKQMLFASLGNMESPSTRIAAAMKAYRMQEADKDIVDALVTTMNEDPSTNVRLAALEALSRFHRENYVKKKLIASLKKQKDPMVQIELIQVLTQMKQKSILDDLQKMVQDVNTNEAVKERAYSSILTLGS